MYLQNHDKIETVMSSVVIGPPAGALGSQGICLSGIRRGGCPLSDRCGALSDRCTHCSAACSFRIWDPEFGSGRHSGWCHVRFGSPLCRRSHPVPGTRIPGSFFWQPSYYRLAFCSRSVDPQQSLSSFSCFRSQSSGRAWLYCRGL
jgi:hypothetical protein